MIVYSPPLMKSLNFDLGHSYSLARCERELDNCASYGYKLELFSSQSLIVPLLFPNLV